MDYKWLKIDPELWDSDKNFGSAKDFVKTVLNDVAERGVKVVQSYFKLLTQDDKVRLEIHQAVERNRKLYPDFKKNTLNF